MKDEGKRLTVGSLFSGIGGIDLGLQRAGMRIAWQVEIDDYARRVLARHWPDVKRWDDVKTFPPDPVGDWRVDLIAGGFPCQPVSVAGKGLGDADERWLWPEFARVLRILRPRWVLLENVPRLLSIAAGRLFRGILGDLADLGFDAEWAVLPASAFGARHIRARVFVVAHAQCGGRDGVHEWQQAGRVEADAGEGCADVPGGRPAVDPAGGDVSHADGRRQQERPQFDRQQEKDSANRDSPRQHLDGLRHHVPDPDRQSLAVGEERILPVERPAPVGSGWWAVEPPVGRVVDGFPGRVDRVAALGNAVVPQVAQWIGERILAAVQERR